MKKMLWVTMALTLVAAAAMAQYPGPDSMGIYASDDGSNVEPCADIPLYTPTTLYFAVTNPSTPQAKAWEATVSDLDPTLALGDWVIQGTPTPIIVDNGDGTHSYAVGYANPLTPNASGVMTLMTVTVIITNTAGEIPLYVTPYPGSQTFDNAPGYAPDVGIYRPCVTSTGGFTTPCFIVNPTNSPCGIVPAQNKAWGQVKSLYR